MSHGFRLLNPLERAAALHGRCALTVMAKAPVAGRVKTRLSPPLSAAEAAALNADFLRDTLASLNDAAQVCAADCVVSYTPIGEEAAFSGVLPGNTLLLPQRGNGFGERLLASAVDLFACGYSAVCLIDSDSPTVPTAEYVRAVETLLADGERRIVLGRSEDGGYYLIGLAAPHTCVFEDIAWSTEVVADQTEQRAQEAGLAVTRLATWYDVDDRISLDRLRREMAGDAGVPQGYAASHTRAFLARLAAAHKENVLADRER